MGVGKGILPLGEGYYTFPGRVIYLSGEWFRTILGIVPYYSGNRSVLFLQPLIPLPEYLLRPVVLERGAWGPRSAPFRGRLGMGLENSLQE